MYTAHFHNTLRNEKEGGNFLKRAKKQYRGGHSEAGGGLACSVCRAPRLSSPLHQLFYHLPK